MKIDFKFKIHSSMSQETMAYTSTLLIDGRKTATLRNSGTGGCTHIYWESGVSREQISKIEEAAMKMIPQNERDVVNYAGGPVEYLSDEAAETYEQETKVVRRCKRNKVCCARFSTNKEKGWIPFVPGMEQAAKDDITMKHGKLTEWVVLC